MRTEALFSRITCLKDGRITLRRLTDADHEGLCELTNDPAVYRFLPTYLYEQRYADKHYVIRHLYDECIKTSLILGVFAEDVFCGLAELYGCSAPPPKVSVGQRLIQSCWGKGIATEALGILVKYLFSETDVKIITASSMAENKASAGVLKKNGFRAMNKTLTEDWGYSKPILTQKWVKTRIDDRLQHRSR